MDDGNRRQAVAGATGGEQDRSVMSKIMQRFRPIAPKPVAGGSVKSDAFDGTKCFAGRSQRSKRKYVRVRNNNNNSRSKGKRNDINYNNGYKRKISRSPTADLDKDTEGDDGSRENIVTLQLLPEKEEDLGTRETVFNFTDSVRTENNYGDPLSGEYGSIVGLSSLDRTVVESWVTVESVTGTCTDEAGVINQLGRTDVERVMCLEDDTCPGFVSDESNRVRWVNGSYRRMVVGNEREDVRVWVVAKEEQMEEMACMGELYGAVTCRVRVQYESTWRKEKSQSAVKMTVPCDVWKMGCGGFAWRLDVEAALRLGR